MKIDSQTVGMYIERFQAELGLVSATLREKGVKHFARPLSISALLVLGSYFLVYKPPIRKRALMEKKLASAKEYAKYADEYKSLRDQLNAAAAELPSRPDREGWLTVAVNDSMRAENMVAQSIQPPVEQAQQGFLQQSVSVAMDVKFQELYSWLSRVESVRPLLHVSQIELSKRADKLGYNRVTCSVSTLIPSPGGR